MSAYSIRHRTEYHYRQPVRLGPHGLMLRPRESRELRLVSNEITDFWPPATMSWAQDVFGNTIATANFAEEAKSLIIESLVHDRGTDQRAPWPVFPIDTRAIQYPFDYTAWTSAPTWAPCCRRNIPIPWGGCRPGPPASCAAIPPTHWRC